MTSSLPKCVYFKHGAYYLVKGGKWHFLTKDRDGIDEQLHLRFGFANGVVPTGWTQHQQRNAMDAYIATVLVRARQNAKGRKRVKEFTLTVEQAIEKLRETKYRCSVTGTPLSLEVMSHDQRKPFAPSIDRIDNELGYTEENCRIVCLAANIAMNTWGEGVLRTMLSYAKSLPNIRQTPKI